MCLRGLAGSLAPGVTFNSNGHRWEALGAGNAFLQPYLYKNGQIYLDRLRTNIGKVEQKGVYRRRALAVPRGHRHE